MPVCPTRLWDGSIFGRCLTTMLLQFIRPSSSTNHTVRDSTLNRLIFSSFRLSFGLLTINFFSWVYDIFSPWMLLPTRLSIRHFQSLQTCLITFIYLFNQSFISLDIFCCFFFFIYENFVQFRSLEWGCQPVLAVVASQTPPGFQPAEKL